MAAGNEISAMEERLFEASMKGSVESLKQVLVEDPLALARVAALTWFDETPLHVAAMLGHLDFVKFVVVMTPDMAEAVDQKGRSPLHVAAGNGYVEIVNALVSVNPNVCLLKDEDGRTPLHLAVMKGQAEVITKLARSHPEVVQGETVAHLAVKQNQLGALKLLFDQLGTDDDHLLGAKDDQGNTILHLAAGLKQTETVKYLVGRSRAAKVKLNAVNGKGLTALDMIEYMPRDLKQVEIRECLVDAGALRAGKTLPASAAGGSGHSILKTDDTSIVVAEAEAAATGTNKVSPKIKEEWVKRHCDALLIAATVFATIAYQSGVNPASGVWDDHKFNEKRNRTEKAGTSIMASNYEDWYIQYMAYNTVCYVAGLSVILLLISGLPMKRRIFMWILMVAMWVTLTFMALTYLISLWVVSPDHELGAIASVVVIAVLVWLGLIAGVVLANITRLIIFCLPTLRKIKNDLSTLP